MNTRSTTSHIDLTNATIDPACQKVTPLFRLLRGEVKPFTSRHDPARKPHAWWKACEQDRPGKWKYDDPRRVIPQLINGRIHAPPYPSIGERKHMYVMSAPQVLDFVGVSEPTVSHLQIAEEALRALLGEPKTVFCRKRWLIHPRGNDEALNPNLSKKFKVPAMRDFQWREQFDCSALDQLLALGEVEDAP